MSVISDSIRKHNNKSTLRENLAEKDSYEDQIRERLADTYLRSSDSVKTEQSSPETKRKSLLPIAVIASSLTLLLACGILIYIFATHALMVDVTITKKVNSPYENLLLTQNIDLIGSATGRKGRISLMADSQTQGGVLINLRDPVDLSKKDLSIGVSSRKSGSSIKVILRDKNHRSYVSDTLHLNGDGNIRQNFIISADKPKDSIDVQNILHIRLETAESVNNAQGGSIILLERVLLVDK